MRIFLAMVMSPLFLSAAAFAGESVIAPGAGLEKLVDDCKFTEGPAADADGNVYFTDQPNDRILKWSIDGKLSHLPAAVRPVQRPVLRRQGQPLGLRRREERAVVHRPGRGRSRSSSRTTRASCSTAPTTSGSGPTAALYFTDPFYKRDYWKRGPKEQDAEAVYYLAPDRQDADARRRRHEAAQRHHRHARRQDALRLRHRRRTRPTPTTSSRTARWRTSGSSASSAPTA